MPQATDQYLQELRSILACFARGKDILGEVAGHLEDSTGWLERSVLDREAAAAEAINRLGSPSTIAAAFTANGEPLAIPTRFTRFTGKLALLSLPVWIAAIGFMFASDLAERWYHWEALPQTLWTFGMFTLLVASIGLLVCSIGLNRRSGGLGTAGGVAIALLALGVVATPMAWFIPGWGTVMTIALAALAFRLRSRHSPFTRYIAVATLGPALAIVAFFVFVGHSETWSVSFAFMLIPATALAALGLRLMREPDIAVPGRISA